MLIDYILVNDDRDECLTFCKKKKISSPKLCLSKNLKLDIELRKKTSSSKKFVFNFENYSLFILNTMQILLFVFSWEKMLWNVKYLICVCEMWKCSLSKQWPLACKFSKCKYSPDFSKFPIWDCPHFFVYISHCCS